MKIAVIIQARMGSTRLPGKVLLPLSNRPILSHIIERCRAIEFTSEIIVATTVHPEDDPIEDLAKKELVVFFRGSESNVLSRYYEAAKKSGADIIVRVTSDCPLLDPNVSSKVIETFINSPGTDYCSNTIIRSFPQGLDTEVFSFAALEKAYLQATEDYEREHVTPYLYQHPDLFKIVHYKNECNYSDYRWTVDTPDDYQLVMTIYNALYQPGNLFSWNESIELMKHNPNLNAINAHILQKKLGE